MDRRISKNRNTKKRGSILVEIILSLWIVLLFIAIPIEATNLLQRNLQFEQNVQDEISLLQLKRILLLSYDIHVEKDYLTFIYEERECILSLINQKLILQPGTYILLIDIDAISFSTNNNMIFISFEREGKKKQYAIAKGIFE
ncbi:MAG: hypothetical protein IJ875_03580 [Solobacterium sp.]|nr:hypothetical protein [Solobacterium sp.]